MSFNLQSTTVDHQTFSMFASFHFSLNKNLYLFRVKDFLTTLKRAIQEQLEEKRLNRTRLETRNDEIVGQQKQQSPEERLYEDKVKRETNNV